MKENKYDDNKFFQKYAEMSHPMMLLVSAQKK